MSVSDERLRELIRTYDQQAFRGDLHAALRELASLREQVRWRPMEEAPKDGTRVQVWLADEGFALFAHWRVPPMNEGEEPCWWSFEWDMDIGLVHELTHWRPEPIGPLPEAGRE